MAQMGRQYDSVGFILEFNFSKFSLYHDVHFEILFFGKLQIQ